MSDQKPNPVASFDVSPEDITKAANENNAPSSNDVTESENSQRTTSAGSNTSPTRSRPSQASQPTVPSAAAVQRAISATRQAPSNVEGSLDSAKERLQRSGQHSPAWPTSPRLKSPPPSVIRSMIPRRIENESTQMNAAAKRLAPVSIPELGPTMQIQQDEDKDSPNLYLLPRPPGRGVSLPCPGLATVDEISVSATPPTGSEQHQQDSSNTETTPLEQTSDVSSEQLESKQDTSTPNDSFHQLSLSKSEVPVISAPSSRPIATAMSESNLAKRSFTSLTATKSKPGTEPLRSMTVETETVSTPQLLGDRGRDTGGSVRTKVSNETIRPKKERKRPPRKTPSLHAGAATSKADIFEAKVANAVDEADSSDSDETFVYESNPPEPRMSRHHSRTPSATSVASQADYYGGRGKHGVRSGSAAIPGKRSMKFSSSVYGNQLDTEGSGLDGGRNSTRTQSSTPRHHHIGRHGRNGHTSIIDSDSPFTQANRVGSPRTPTTNQPRYSRPDSPRLSNGRLVTSSRKTAGGGYDTYDDGADDERAPLIGSVRVNRSRFNRRPNGHFRAMDFNEQPDPGCWPRFGGCVLLGMLIVLVCIALTTFVVALNRPLLDVEVKHIQSVLATEQELMLDLHVTAVNPNLFAIAVNELNVDLFAESPYSGTAGEWEKHQDKPRSSWTARRRELVPSSAESMSWFPPFHGNDGVDEGTDPIDDEPGVQKMLLGRITEFDSPLVFDASPFRHSSCSSVGEIRLAKPGNKTEIGGSARWERVIQHRFDLIVRGVIRYQLPLSSRTRSAKVAGRIKVLPNSDNGDDGDDLRNRTQSRIEKDGQA